jgi:hypothetical protein
MLENQGSPLKQGKGFLKKKFTILKSTSKTDIVVHTCNASSQEAEPGGLRVQYKPGLNSEILSQK